MDRLIVLAALLLSLLSSFANAAKNNTNVANPIIVDTDIMTDCDDAGALAIANVFHNCGLCDLRAVMINTHSEYGALATSAINTYYGNGHVPIAALRPLTNETFFDRRTWTRSDYASKVAHNFPRALLNTSSTPDPVTLYLDLLTSAADHSLTLISIGFLTNLSALLQHLADTNRTSLLTRKVRHLVIMGGDYPSTRTQPTWEYNFAGIDPHATAHVLAHWPSSIPRTYIGYTLGARVVSGQDLAAHASPASPVLAAYQWYMGRCSTAQKSFDPLAVLYAVLSLPGDDGGEGAEGVLPALGLSKSPFRYGNTHGFNAVVSQKNGSNYWVWDESVTNQHWLELVEDGDVTNTSVAAILTQLFAHDPEDGTCFFE